MKHILHATFLTIGLLAPAARAQVSVEPGYVIELLASGIDRPFVAPGPATNGFTGELYVTNGATQQIVRIDLSGNTTPFADLSAIVPFDAIFWSTFDLVGNYGGHLFVNDDNNALPDRVYSVQSSGMGAVFTTGPGSDNDALAFDPFGAFGGALFLHDGASQETLFQVSPAGAVTPFATAIPDFTGQIAFSPGGGFGDSMFVAGEANGRIYTVQSGHTPGQPASLFAGFQANSGSVFAGGIAISEAGPFGVDVMYVNDRNTSSIIRVAPSGHTTGILVTGLAGSTLIDLPRAGDFAGRMVLTDLGNGSIYVVTPVSQVPAMSLLPLMALSVLVLTTGAIAIGRRHRLERRP